MVQISFPIALAGSPYGSVTDLTLALALRRRGHGDLVEELFSEYAAELSARTIVDLVQQCRMDLHGLPTGGMPGVLDRLTRDRLDVLPAEDSGSARPQGGDAAQPTAVIKKHVRISKPKGAATPVAPHR
jgi:hypothetical protein